MNNTNITMNCVRLVASYSTPVQFLRNVFDLGEDSFSIWQMTCWCSNDVPKKDLFPKLFVHSFYPRQNNCNYSFQVLKNVSRFQWTPCLLKHSDRRQRRNWFIRACLVRPFSMWPHELASMYFIYYPKEKQKENKALFEN